MLFAKRLLRGLILGLKNWAEFDLLPRRITLVRHGLSEANEIRKRKEDGVISTFPQWYIDTPDREMRLEQSVGIHQPEVTGDWIGKNCEKFDVAVAADHVRAYETAGRLGLGMLWTIDCFYGERYWGDIDLEVPEVREAFYELRKRDPMHATPPNGERLLSARHRARVFLERGARQFPLSNVLGVFHGELIESIICEILHLNTEEFKTYLKSELGGMGNCQVVEFSRVCPWTSKVYRRMFAMRSSNPYLKEFGEWQRISELPFARRKFSDSDLLNRAGGYSSFVAPLPSQT